MFKRLLMVAALAVVSCDGDALAASPPIGSVQGGKVVTVNGIATGTTQLSTMSTVGLPTSATRAWVPTVGDWFVLGPGGGTPVANVLVNAFDTGRQWSRQSVPNQTFIAAAFWAIDPVGGSDEAQCWGASLAAADAVACRSLREVNRRLVGSDISGTVFFHLLADTAVSDSTVMSNVQSLHGTGLPIFLGKKAQVGSDYTVSAYAAAVPASNTGYLLSATGIGAGANVGHLISNAAENKWAFVQSNPTGNQVRLTQPNNFDLPTFGGGFAAVFTVGETVRVWTLPLLRQWPWPLTVYYPSVDQVHLLGGFATGTFEIAAWGATSPVLAHTIIDGLQAQGGVQGAINGCLFSTTSSNLSHAISIGITGTGVLGTNLLMTGGVALFSQVTDFENSQLTMSDFANPFFNDATASFAIFDVPSGIQQGAAIFGNARSSLAVFSSSSRIWGSGNSAVIYKVGPGSQSAISKTLSSVATSAAHPLSIAGVAHDFSDIPIADVATGTWVND